MVLKGIDRCLGTIADFKFARMLDTWVLTVLGEIKFVCDTLIFVALGDELENISLTRSQVPSWVLCDCGGIRLLLTSCSMANSLQQLP